MSDPARALSQVLGRGSAHEGAHHWRVQRLTALALLLLTPWFVISLALLPRLDFVTLHEWAGGLVQATLLALLLVSACWHSQLGVQVVIEDYVHTRWMEITLQLLVTFACTIGALASLYAIARIALTAAY